MAGQPVIAKFETVERNGPGGRLVLHCGSNGDTRRFVISGYDGPELPAHLSDATIEPPSDHDTARGRWRLRSREGDFAFQARAVDVIEERPALYQPLHRSFALSTTDRFAVRILLWMLRLPGGARLLRRWHAGRAP
ncbi:MAG TPA: hypothetical protein VD701_00075 [Steroidobacteraceae bacterium]|nr:hypothetical protein [Steroidobacteraceae bacterium]